MALRLGDIAPDFTAETTEGPIRFHEWIGNSWAVLFSHPKDFTPVCTTELGECARLKPEFEQRNVKVIGLSVDPADSHQRWAEDIRETQGSALNFPVIADPDRFAEDHDLGTRDLGRRGRFANPGRFGMSQHFALGADNARTDQSGVPFL